jgi:L-ascorbate metabolism protein UlaG (beta-lactamase superfamily)
MELKYYGHSAFLVSAADGTRIIIDPYLYGAFGGAFRYGAIDEPADLVVATHKHDDHGAVDGIPGDPRTFVHPERVEQGVVTVTGIPAAHDSKGGAQRGLNTLIVVDDGQIRLVHLGDLGHELDEETRSALGRVDVLLVPVGGTYTVDARTASRVVAWLAPRIAVPMHYKTPLVDLPLTPVDDFLAYEARAGHPVRRAHSSSVSLDPAQLPEATTVLVLDHAR